jgi:hypothetical protein
MTKTNRTLLILFTLFFSATLNAQNKESARQKKNNYISNRQLIGKWQSEADSNYILLFGKQKFVELYGKDTTGRMYYKLSITCFLKDSLIKLDLRKAYLLFYSKDNSVNQCNDILNLNSYILSWIDNSNGKISVFRKTEQKNPRN